jgi:hypothetical protein
MIVTSNTSYPRAEAEDSQTEADQKMSINFTKLFSTADYSEFVLGGSSEI